VIPLGEVREVRSVARDLAQLLELFEQSQPSSAEPMLDLARFARARELAGLAEVFALRALVADPDKGEAHELLGHELRGKRWQVREEGRWIPFDELGEVRADWQSAWRLRTPHYDVRTNLTLLEAFEIALDLELFYREFFGLFGKQLELNEIVLPLPVHVHATRKSFPELVGARSYFDRALTTVITTAEGGAVRDSVLHEATHQLLYATAASPEHHPRAKGCLPSWLDEGLAVWFEVIQDGPPGRVTFDEKRSSLHYLTLHRAADKPYDLSRVLTFGSDDFHASTRIDLKYAEAYTLVEFFLRGDYYAHRESFFAVLRNAYGGNCSSQDVRRALTVGPEEFERAWEAHVGRVR
jgi:hypothetical protein